MFSNQAYFLLGKLEVDQHGFELHQIANSSSMKQS